MNAKEWSTKIDLSKLDFSLLIVTPKQPFVEWVKEFFAKKGLEEYEVYFPEEDSVWLIPKIERFSKPGSYEEFLDEVKPRLLLSELYRFGAVEADFEHDVNKEVFDNFFDLALRSQAASISILF